MKTAEEYLREQIPTMVGERHVSDMMLSSMLALLKGYARIQIEKDRERVKNGLQGNGELMTGLRRLIDETPIIFDSPALPETPLPPH